MATDATITPDEGKQQESYAAHREGFMDGMKSARSMDAVMGVSVHISSGEVLKLVANDLVCKRNACRNQKLIMHFDAILKDYYLSDEEFEVAISKGGSQ